LTITKKRDTILNIVKGEVMRLSIINCPDRKRFAPLVKRAAKFYAEELISKKLLENLFLRINFTYGSNELGFASISEYNFSGKPREFEIELNAGAGGAEILQTLAHEMVHVKQFALCETNESLTRWKGNRVSESDYWKEPWEVEAYGLEVGLWTKFAVKEKLWEILEGVKNPTETILEIKDIGWKQKDCCLKDTKLLTKEKMPI
jgi:hypothetical protein